MAKKKWARVKNALNYKKWHTHIRNDKEFAIFLAWAVVVAALLYGV